MLPPLIECHGDSTTWGAVFDRLDLARNRAFYSQTPVPPIRTCEQLLRNRFGALFCFNLGVNQARSADLLGDGSTWAARMKTSPAAVVCLNLGMNDVRDGLSALDYSGRMSQLVDGALRAGKWVVVEAPNPVSDGKLPYGEALVASRLDALVEALLSVLQSRPVSVCDHYHDVQKIAGWADLVPVDVHPNAQLYAIRGTALGKKLIPIVSIGRAGVKA